MIEIDIADFQKAQKMLQAQRVRSSLITAQALATPSGNPILLKAESLLPSGSFKIRGATYCLSLLSEEQKTRGVLAYSTGNHAQAVARAAQLVGVKAVIVMSPDAPPFKVEATKAYGATVVMAEPSSQARRQLAEELAQKYGYYLVPPYDHQDVIIGQGTIGIEILQDLEPAAVFVPIGGGGLLAGIALAIKKLNPNVNIIGVEPELENDAYQSFKMGNRVRLHGPSTSIADAIKVQVLGDITYPIIASYVDDIVQVTEEQIVEAIKLHVDKAHLVVEPAGALALAAALAYNKSLLPLKPVVCIASGGNTLLSEMCKICNFSGGILHGKA